MKTESRPEIVEMIDDGAGAFYDYASGRPLDDARSGSRWLGPVTAAALLAAFGYGVVTSAINSDIPTKPADPTNVQPEFYVAEPPAGFTMYLAEDRDEGAASAANFADSGPAEMWATSDATGTTGAWFVVSQGDHHATGRNAYRTTVDGMEVIIEHDPPTRQARLSFIKDGYPMEITALGWLDRQLVKLVRSVSIADGGIRFSNNFFVSDHRRVLTADPTVALFGLPLARVGYSTSLPARLAENFTITVSGDAVVDPSRVTKFALTDSTPFTLGDRAAIIGRSTADPTVSIAQWRDGDRLITLTGNVGVDRLRAIAETVHPRSDDEVHEQLETASPQPAAALGVEPSTVVSGMLSDGWGWAIQVSQIQPHDPVRGYLWWIGQPGDTTRPSETRPSLPVGAPTIETIVEHGRTYVLAKVPRSMDGAELHVNPTGEPSTVTPLHDVNAEMADQFAAAVFFEPVPFTAQIIDANGETVVAWPSL